MTPGKSRANPECRFRVRWNIHKRDRKKRSARFREKVEPRPALPECPLFQLVSQRKDSQGSQKVGELRYGRRHTTGYLVSAETGEHDPIPSGLHAVCYSEVGVGEASGLGHEFEGAAANIKIEKAAGTEMNVQAGPSPMFLDLAEKWLLLPVRL